MGGDAVVVVPPAGVELVTGWELDVSAALLVWFAKSAGYVEKVTFLLYQQTTKLDGKVNPDYDFKVFLEKNFETPFGTGFAYVV